MTDDEIKAAFEHHCLSNEPSLLCEPRRWWKNRRTRKEEAGKAWAALGPPSPCFFLHPLAWFDWWFLLQEGRNYTNFYMWKWDVLDEWRNQWRRCQMVPKEPPNPTHVWVAKQILRDLQNLEEEKNTQDAQDKKLGR